MSTDSDRESNYYQKLSLEQENKQSNFNEMKIETRKKKEYEKREMAVVNASKLSTKKYVENNNSRESLSPMIDTKKSKKNKPNDTSQSSSATATDDSN